MVRFAVLSCFFAPCLARFEDDGALLSVRSVQSDSGASVYVTTPDFMDKVAVDREFVDTYPQEVLVKMPLAENHITVETINHVNYLVLPMDHHYLNMVAARTTRTDGTSHEFGDLRWIGEFGDKDLSPIPGAILGFAERFFVYEHDGAWVETEEIKSAQEVAQEPAEVTAGAVGRWGKAFQYMAAGQLSKQHIAAAVDPMAASELKTWMTNHPTVAQNPSDIAKAKAMHERLEAGMRKVSAMSSGTAPSSVATNCFHLLEHPYIIQDREKSVVKVPLGVNLPMMRGQTVFSPTYQFSVAAGHSFFNIEDGHVLIYTGAMSYAAYNVNRQNSGTASATSTYRFPPKLYLTEPGGTGVPPQAVQLMDLRATEHNPATKGGLLDMLQDLQKPTPTIIGKNSPGHQLFMSYSEIPMSYAFLSQNENEICSPQLLEHLKSTLQSSNYQELAKDGLTAEEGQQMLTGFFGALPCGLHFLRGAQDFSNGLDFFELSVWMHFLSETPADKRLNAIRGSETLGDGWHWKHLPATHGEVPYDADPVDIPFNDKPANQDPC